MNIRTRFPVILLQSVILLTLCSGSGFAQRDLAGAEAIKDSLSRLNGTGSVLMIAAHPDDENNPLIAYLARGRKLRTGYLALTRGEGGQNLIGPEKGDLLGLVRTQELLRARLVDGGEQFFSRAIDFGFSKTADETLSKWGRDEVLGDVVWVIRKFRPDVIILRFSGTPRDGHGQHQASAILAKEAFTAAADANRFPEQLKYVRPWQTKRILWNVFSFNAQQQKEAEALQGKLPVDVGEYDPVLGYSYRQIGAMSRSMHRSQGQGTPEERGTAMQYMITVAGGAAKTDFLDGVDTTWNRFPGGAELGRILAEAAKTFVPEHPENTVPLLVSARKLMTKVDPDRVSELDEAIASCAGLWADVSAEKNTVVRGSEVKVQFTSVVRTPARVRLLSEALLGDGEIPKRELGKALSLNVPEREQFQWSVPATQPYTEKYWLAEPHSKPLYTVAGPRMIGMPDSPPVMTGEFVFEIAGERVVLHRPMLQRYVDRGRGELTRPVVVVPKVSVSFGEEAVVFPDTQSRRVEVALVANAPNIKGEIALDAPAGWEVQPKSESFALASAGEQANASFQVTPPAKEDTQRVQAVATVAGERISAGMVTISYPHFPQQNTFPRAEASLVRTDIHSLAKNIGYVMGVGDEVPQAMQKLGWTVTLLDSEALARGDLSHFDAVVTGICAFNVRPDLRANVPRLREYVQAGGTMVAQYNGVGGSPCTTNMQDLEHVGPYPMKFSDARVTNEDAPVAFPKPQSPLLHVPNEITEKDFSGWIQERGLKFAVEWDPHYQPLFEMHDPGEKPLLGSTLVTKYGKGAYVFTALAFFRELPAGVPGAYRIFANLLSAGKTLQ